MGTYDVDELYSREHFKEGHSRKVDEAIAALLQVLRSSEAGLPIKHADFNPAWQRLLGVLVSEFPNISPYNLVALSLPLEARRFYEEDLMICRFMAELNPDSSESQCFLGHAYRRVGDLEVAAVCYRRAYDLVESRLGKRKSEQSYAMRLDASDYLRYLAEVQNDLRRHADAFANATKVLAILNTVDATDHVTTKKGVVCGTLQRICLRMNLDDLAQHYGAQAARESE